MNKLFEFWDRIVRMGVLAKQSKMLNKRILLTNQLCLVLLGIVSLDLLANYPDWTFPYFLRMSLLMVTCVSVLTLHFFSFTFLGRFLFAILPAFILFYLPIFLQDVEEGFFLWFPYGLTMFSCLSFLLFNLGEERYYSFGLSFAYLAGVLTIDTVMWSWKTEEINITLIFEHYIGSYKLPQFYLWLSINTIFYFQKINSEKKEGILKKLNDTLRQKLNIIQNQSEEIITQNEELVEQQEEIRAQKEQILQQKIELELREQKIKYYNEVLMNLTKSPEIQKGDWDNTLQVITHTVSQTLQTNRVSIWRFLEVENAIECLCLFEQEKANFSNGILLYAQDFPRYFNAIHQENVVIASDAYKHPATMDFGDSYLTPHHIYSMMDAPYFWEGKLGGVICCENQYHYKDWQPEDLGFLKSVADILTIAFRAYLRKKDVEKIAQQKEAIEAQHHQLQQKQQEIQHINASLEEKIKERTALLEVQNKQLAEYAFINAHLLRGPLCRIMGLVNLMDLEEMDAQKSNLLPYLHHATQELDEIVGRINQTLDEGSNLDEEDLSVLRDKVRRPTQNL